MDYEKAIRTKNRFMIWWVILGISFIVTVIIELSLGQFNFSVGVAVLFIILCGLNVWINHEDKKFLRLEKRINEDTYRIQDRVEERIRELKELEG